MKMDVVLKRHCSDEVWDAGNGKEESGEGGEWKVQGKLRRGNSLEISWILKLKEEY